MQREKVVSDINTTKALELLRKRLFDLMEEEMILSVVKVTLDVN